MLELQQPSDNRNLILVSWNGLMAKQAALALFSLFHLQDLDGVCVGTVPGTRVLVALCDGTSHGQVPVLMVQIVCATEGVTA